MSKSKYIFVPRPTIFDLCPVLSDFRRSRLLKRHPEQIKKKGILHLIAKNTYKHFFTCFRRQTQPVADGAALVFVITQNQKQAAQLLIQKLNCSVIYSSTKVDVWEKTHFLFRKDIAWFRGLIKIPIIVWDYFKCKSPVAKRSVLYRFDYYVDSIGAYYHWRSVLQKIRPTSVIVSNDYNMYCRALLFAAKSLKIPSHYIPHALIGIKHYTPPVPVSDYIYIDNELERSRVMKRVKQARVHLPEIKYLKRYSLIESNCNNSNRQYYVLGFSINGTDSYELISSVAEKLTYFFPFMKKILLRPHPRMKNIDQFKDIFADCPIEFQIHKDDFEDYWNRIDFHISGASMMHLDAVRHGKATFIMPGAEQHDHYGFTSIGLSHNLSEPLAEDEVRDIQQKQYEAARYWFGQHGTQ